MINDEETDPTLYERNFLNGQFANWRMSTKYANINPRLHFAISITILFAILGMMLGLSQLGMCYVYPKSVWPTTCDIGSSIIVTTGKIELTHGNCDTIYDKEDWKNMPTVKLTKAIQGRLYTVFVLDPDVPNGAVDTYYLLMALANVKGEDFVNGSLEGPSTLAAYAGPATSKGEGLHRFMVVIYQHCSPTDVLPPMEISSRDDFDLGKWFRSIPISMLGPIAGVQFRAHVP